MTYVGQKELSTSNITISATKIIGGKVDRSIRTVVTSKDDIVAELHRKPGFLKKLTYGLNMLDIHLVTVNGQ
ncbi:MAG: hypothetical protein COY68_02180 [Candidatus Levybacteria bacterium CG_4_10_14_0_8_um_filter_35_23]|nr:MAG: hypothetical protein COY68_02180 [Candidatus Levybacteria bacterium CG_4_10_14_0_8_um_filter_35_23]